MRRQFKVRVTVILLSSHECVLKKDPVSFFLRVFDTDPSSMQLRASQATSGAKTRTRRVSHGEETLREFAYKLDAIRRMRGEQYVVLN